MIEISYLSAVIFISIVWCLVRVLFAIKNKGIQWKREAQLILVYVCIIVVARFTFFPFFKVNGEIQPLVFEVAKAFPFRINLVPFVSLFAGGVQRIIRLQNDESPAERCPFSRLRESV